MRQVGGVAIRGTHSLTGPTSLINALLIQVNLLGQWSSHPMRSPLVKHLHLDEEQTNDKGTFCWFERERDMKSALVVMSHSPLGAAP